VFRLYKQFILYVIDSSKSNEKLGKLKVWLDSHINQAFKATEITESDDQCEFLSARKRQITIIIFNMTNSLLSFVKKMVFLFPWLYLFIFKDFLYKSMHLIKFKIK